MTIIIDNHSDEILEEAEKAIRRNEQRKNESVDEWARKLAQSQIVHEKSLPKEDRTRAFKRIII